MPYKGVCVHTSKNNEFFNKDKKYFPDREYFQHIPDIRQQQNIMKKKFLKEKENLGNLFFFLHLLQNDIHIFVTGRSRPTGRHPVCRIRKNHPS